MHSYSTLPNMAQKYRTPMWKVPSCGNLEPRRQEHHLQATDNSYENTQTGFNIFAKDLLTRLSQLEVDNG